MLTLYGNISRLSDYSVEYRLAKRQLKIKTLDSHSWFIAVKKILIKYDLPSPEALLGNPMKKYVWKRLYNTAIDKFWSKRIVSQSRLYSSLSFLSKTYEVGKPILKDLTDVLTDLLVEYPSIGDFGLLQLLIDSNIIAQVYDLSVYKNLRVSIELLHYYSRRLIYALHATRYQKLEIVSKRIKKKTRARSNPSKMYVCR